MIFNSWAISGWFWTITFVSKNPFLSLCISFFMKVFVICAHKSFLHEKYTLKNSTWNVGVNIVILKTHSTSVYFKLTNIKQDAIQWHAWAALLKLNLISATLLFWIFLKRRLNFYFIISINFLTFPGHLKPH